MSNQRYTPEFKQEAVRQIIERGYSVAEVSERLGVSDHSLYNWVKAAHYASIWNSTIKSQKKTNGKPIYSYLWRVK